MRQDEPKRTNTLDPTLRLRIATHIHFALLRQYGEDVAVSTLLRDGGDAREALWVCEASGHDELVLLAKQFKAAPKPMPAAAPQEMGWARETSGFGVSRQPQAADAPAERSGAWLKPSRWLRGGSGGR